MKERRQKKKEKIMIDKSVTEDYMKNNKIVVIS